MQPVRYAPALPSVLSLSKDPSIVSPSNDLSLSKDPSIVSPSNDLSLSKDPGIVSPSNDLSLSKDLSGAGDLVTGSGAFAGGSGATTNQFAQVTIHGVVGCISSVAGGGMQMFNQYGGAALFRGIGLQSALTVRRILNEQKPN